eukprot:c5571_g2_i2.p1 GENE.c5571_g2_i2~~c5571_g2_i2.p1  ORF type:complete len:397 (+),score=52.37 c5571_g2_i2:194-1384(+)
MDVGVGAFVFAAGFVAGRPKHASKRHPALTSTPRSPLQSHSPTPSSPSAPFCLSPPTAPCPSPPAPTASPSPVTAFSPASPSLSIAVPPVPLPSLVLPSARVSPQVAKSNHGSKHQLFSSNRALQEKLSTRFISGLRKALPALLLGTFRAISVRATDYQEHVSEYGTHWNFFLTIAALQLVDHVACVEPASSLLSGGVLLLMYQGMLGCGLSEYILDAPRSGLFSSNREGILGLFGLCCSSNLLLTHTWPDRLFALCDLRHCRLLGAVSHIQMDRLADVSRTPPPPTSTSRAVPSPHPCSHVDHSLASCAGNIGHGHGHGCAVDRCHGFSTVGRPNLTTTSQPSIRCVDAGAERFSILVQHADALGCSRTGRPRDGGVWICGGRHQQPHAAGVSRG